MYKNKSGMAWAYSSMKKSREACQTLQECVDFRRNKYDTQDPQLASWLVSLGSNLSLPEMINLKPLSKREAEKEKCLKMVNEGLAVYEKHYGRTSCYMGMRLVEKGACLYHLEKYDESVKVLLEAFQIFALYIMKIKTLISEIVSVF